ncbi:prohibitin family protein [Nostoc sp. FACHB-152]|uniref:prohibitin family protein n=1 Tax=unclassified Nostoc TaxID=2593658 RepID=UPI001683E956|nr:MULTISPECIES: prohibitin family protein [unclassified Nostoc]MBD2446249.1 prohibitin family protein [Nostoc sp. FACHB-152]MBD2469519.1 prohibitin family protein [Nostoc sp. FACHB-145]
MKNNKIFTNPGKLTALLCLITIFLTPCVIVNAGERGVLMRFGEVQEQILGEGFHLIIPVVNTVAKLSVRVQKQEISAEASSKDLQDVFTEVALNWHILPEESNIIYQQIGNEQNIIAKIINPAIEEVLKAVIAQYTAEEIITKRGEVKLEVDHALTTRLRNYHIAVDDVSLVHIHFSELFGEAVEAKQIAEQDAKKAEFLALKAAREAEAKVNLARGEAEAYRLLRDGLTPELLQKQAIEKWNGKLPLVIGKESPKIWDFSELLKAYK